MRLRKLSYSLFLIDPLAAQIPMGRLGTVNEVAQAVLFLAGDSGAYITAQTLHVNGGMYTV